ncbi:MAG: MBL fold metallo-hydrolase [Clostridia bacterium]|nr:MBL fold metallo-hydrolase [Clostridia bacterium]
MKARRFWILFVFCALLLVSCSPGGMPAHPLEVYFLDVGQGDSALIRTRDGDILIDAGPESSQEMLCFRLEELGVTSLRLLILTHPDEDHIGGADAVVRQFDPQQVWTNGVREEDNDSYLALQAALSERGMTETAVSYGSKCLIGEVSLTVLSPYGAVMDGNEGSLILRIQFGEISMLFSGDAEVEAEEDLCARFGKDMLSCDLYKVGHHGSYTSTSQVFLQMMSPKYAVISSGRGNSYGHPHGEILVRLEEAGCEILRTDELGEIGFYSDGSTLERMQ